MKRDDTLRKSILEDIFDDFLVFSRRMFTYYSRILDKYDKPITAFAIFTDANRSFRPCEYYREFIGACPLEEIANIVGEPIELIHKVRLGRLKGLM
ncbi:hypothetical protein [Dyadobacter beijingensis]|nr:hypothetical protein [Dyadobacter beijingensis]